MYIHDYGKWIIIGPTIGWVVMRHDKNVEFVLKEKFSIDHARFFLKNRNNTKFGMNYISNGIVSYPYELPKDIEDLLDKAKEEMD